MEREQGGKDDQEASQLSRRQYLFTTGALVSGTLTAANATAATSTSIDASLGSVNHNWQSIQLTSDYSDPIVVAPALSYNGTNPASPRVRNISSGSFELTVEEWNYLDGAHMTETIGYFVTDSGSSSFGDGTQCSVGATQSNHRWTSVSFSSSFSSTPVVFSNTQTYNGHHAVVTRHRNVSGSGMELQLQEEEAEGPHVKEEVGYLAVQPGSGTVDGRSFEASRSPTVDNSWQTLSFDGSYQNPVFLADLQSSRGINTATVRYRNLTADSVEVKVEEEQSADQETAHLAERLGYLVIEGRSDTTTDDTTSGYGMGEYGIGGYGK